MKNFLSIKDLKLIYHTKTTETLAIKKVSFDVEEGEFVSMIGPSGCGKTSVLSLIAGLIEKSGGSITFLGEDIKKQSKKIIKMKKKKMNKEKKKSKEKKKKKMVKKKKKKNKK